MTQSWLLFFFMSLSHSFRGTPLASRSHFFISGYQGGKRYVTINSEEKVNKLMLADVSREWFSPTPGWGGHLMPLWECPSCRTHKLALCPALALPRGRELFSEGIHFPGSLLVFPVWPNFRLMIGAEGLWWPFIFGGFKKFKCAFEMLIRTEVFTVFTLGGACPKFPYLFPSAVEL